MRLPHFVIIGAMKSATTTLHARLARHPAVFMSTPKEPCFFSDDQVWERGLAWYASLFAEAPETALRGESSTHYTKRPTYPETVARMHATIPDAKLIYVMRHPLDRLVSHYIHEWTEGRIGTDIDRAVDRHPELSAYSRYAYQITPWIEAYGPTRVLPVFFERMKSDADRQLNRVADFLAIPRPDTWEEGERENVSADRLRKGPLLRFVMDTPVVSQVRQALVPRSAREWVKNRFFRMRNRPVLGEDARQSLERIFDEDLARLAELLGLAAPLTCDTFARAAASLDDPRFVGAPTGASLTGGRA